MNGPSRMSERSRPPRLDFRLLGPLEVHADERLVELSSPKHRILLAALLIHRNRTVSFDELADAIWGSEQPARPRRAVQVCVARLRSVLSAAGGGQLIVTRPGGYQMDIPTDGVDVGRFHCAVAAAAYAARRGELDDESAALTQALAQWQGEPLADVPSDTLHCEIVPRLREERLQAMERRIDADLRRGRHVPLIAELSELTAQYPLRERLWGQLMTALSRSGRRAEALRAYHLLRHQLGTELGIDPSDELQHLHAAILFGQAQSTQPHAAALPAMPRQLPPDSRGFVGRVAHLAQLDTVADSDDPSVPICLISGTAGVGKTSLAAYWARRAADRFPAGQLWVNLRGFDSREPMNPEEVLTTFLRALGVADNGVPHSLDDLTGLYRSVMDGRRALVVLDNAGTAEHVRPLLPSAPGCCVVVTSRNQLTSLVALEGAQLINLDLLSEDESHAMLVRRLGIERVRAEPHAVHRIIGAAARLPLALSIVGARAAAQPGIALAELADELDATDTRLEAFTGIDPATDIRTVFSWSYQALSPNAARIFRMLGLHTGPDISRAAVARLVGVSDAALRSPLLELCRANLLTQQVAGRYSFHELLRGYAKTLVDAVDTVDDRRAALHRMPDLSRDPVRRVP